jgi:hypothetical protein
VATAVPEYPIPPGPLAVRFLSYELPVLRAATTVLATVELENAGTGTWHAFGPAHIRLSYHWLDRFGNVLVWEGLRVLPDEPVEPGTRLRLELPVAAPMPPGGYRLVLDVVDEGRLWFGELGGRTLDVDVEVAPRLGRRALAVRTEGGDEQALSATRAALERQEEPVVDENECEAIAFLDAGCEPASDWSRRILDTHSEGFAACAGSIEPLGGRLARRALGRELAAWAPGFGRAPSWQHPLLCPSLLVELVPSARWAEPIAGLPALDPRTLDEPWICDGRIRVGVRR